MQTFIPFSEHPRTARVLDRQRLGKQRVETLQILNALHPEYAKIGWKHHPAVRMWRGHEQALVEYGLYICREWLRRGYQDTCAGKMIALRDDFDMRSAYMPDWWGDPVVHDSHKSNLLRKDPTWYSQWGWEVSDDLPYVWPTN